VIHDAIPDGDLARRRSVMVARRCRGSCRRFTVRWVKIARSDHIQISIRTTKQAVRIHKYEIRTYSCKHQVDKQLEYIHYLD